MSSQSPLSSIITVTAVIFLFIIIRPDVETLIRHPQVDMLSMLHGAAPSYENLGGMFPGQYQ